MGRTDRDLVLTTSGNVTGYVSGGGTVDCCSGSVWAGAEGSSSYTVGDIVTALKRKGVLSQ